MSNPQLRTQVAIIGGGPSGLLLSQLLNRAGIDTLILERSSREKVLSRIRAGVLESGTVTLLEEAGVADRLHREGHPHEGCWFTDDDLMVRINFAELSGKVVTVYGQTEVTRDLYAAQDVIGTPILHDVSDVVIEGADTSQPAVRFVKDGQAQWVTCDYVAGCDGFHGVSRKTIPDSKRKEFERVYPFGWLGILSETKPANPELIYANSTSGFALASMRNDRLSRYYVQVPLSDTPDGWSDDLFWARLQACLPSDVAATMETGPSIEKSIAPLRSFVAEPMRWGRLFLVGDAAHIVPPTGAKGLNLAVSDVFYLHQALIAAMKGDCSGIDGYADRALARVWKAMRFSWQLTSMLHQFEGEDSFAAQMRKATLMHLSQSETARRDLAENYVGLPF